MNAVQKQLIRDSFEKLLPVTTQAGLLFYQKLFVIDPALKPLFSEDLSLQAAKVMQMLHLSVNSIDRIDQLLPILRQLAIRHVRYGVKSSHYKSVGMALMAALADGLGEAFDAETRAAWQALYGLLSEEMVTAAYSRIEVLA